MKKISYIAYALVAAALTGCADYVDTSSFQVEKPSDISEAEYLNEYAPLNTYVDRAARPNFKLGAAVSANDYNNRSTVYALASSNFDMVTPTSEMMHGSCVDGSGILNLEPVRKLALYAADADAEVYGHAIVSNTQQNVSWLKSLEANAVASLGQDDKIVDSHVDYSETSDFPYSLINSFQPKVVDGVLQANMSNKKHQFYLVENLPTIAGMEYELTMRIKANKDANITLQIGGKDNTLKFPVLTDWTEPLIKFVGTGSPLSLIIDPGNVKALVEIAYVDVRHQRELTDAEKLALYTDELDRWVAGLMEASQGKISTWELFNQPIANSGDNGAGYYPLMSASNGSSNNFYWADMIGDIDVVKIAAEYIKKYFAEFGGNANDLCLYVNEDCVNDELKASSLIYWVKKWSDAGVKIDGIGTEMHLKCPANAEDLAQVKKNVDRNLEVLAPAGKLVRISALDIQYVDADGKTVAPADLTEQQRKEVGALYNYVLKTYSQKIPAAQQGGVCLWTIVDGSASGLWTVGLDRTAAYASFADALQGK